jgi:hypothetical protein
VVRWQNQLDHDARIPHAWTWYGGPTFVALSRVLAIFAYAARKVGFWEQRRRAPGRRILQLDF